MDNEFSDEEDEALEEVELGENASAFALLENEYKTVLPKIQEKEELAAFGEHYSKLFEAYFQTYTHEQELITKCDELDKQIIQDKEELQELKKCVEADLEVIEQLKGELADVKKINDNANTREQLSHESIESMRIQILKLKDELELRIAMATDEDDETGAATKLRETIEKEKQLMIDEISSLTQKLTQALKRNEESEHKKTTSDSKIKELSGLLEQHICQESKTRRQNEKLENELAIMQVELENRQHLIQDAYEKMEMDAKRLEEVELQVKLQKTIIDKFSKTEKQVKSKLEKYQQENNSVNEELLLLKQKYAEEGKLLKMKEDECARLKNEIIKISKQRDSYEHKIIALEHIKVNVEQERDKIRKNIDFMEKEINNNKKQSDLDKKTIENLSREKEILHKNVIRIQNTVEEHVKVIKYLELEKRKIESDVQELRNVISKQNKDIAKIDKERSKILEEVHGLTQKLEDAVAEVKLKQQTIYDQKRLVSELEAKMHQQQNIFETVRADRNTFQKAMQEYVMEINELKSSLKISVHQIDQLKEDVAAKEMLLLKEENILKKVNKEKENLKIEVQTGLNSIHKMKYDLQETAQNEKSYLKYIHENEAIIRKQAKDLEQITTDRDIIATDLVRKKHEIDLLKEKINILEITLKRGEAQYTQRLEDIRLLKLEVQTLSQEKKLLSNTISSITDLKQELFNLERELAQERLKCRALEEELQTPMNIHRWRKLEGHDPDVFDLLKKIQLLQKRILNQSNEAIEREEELKESEKLFFNMRQILSRQPGPDVINELTKTQRILATRNKKIKCLTSELSMYETQVMEYKMNIEKLTLELKDMKREYFKQKKINQRHLASNSKLPTISASTQDTQVKFAGGGFRMI